MKARTFLICVHLRSSADNSVSVISVSLWIKPNSSFLQVADLRAQGGRGVVIFLLERVVQALAQFVAPLVLDLLPQVLQEERLRAVAEAALVPLLGERPADRVRPPVDL